jgi:hypothetical protein
MTSVTLHGLFTDSGTEELSLSLRRDSEGRLVVRAANGPRVYEWLRDTLGDTDEVAVPGEMRVSGLRDAIAAEEVR